MNPTPIFDQRLIKTTITPQERFFKKRPQTQQYVSLYLYYIIIIKFNVVPETNHTGQTDAAVRLQTHGPSKERKRQKGTKSSETEKRTQNMMMAMMIRRVHEQRKAERDWVGYDMSK